MVRHFLDLWSLEASELRAILDDAHARKKARLARMIKRAAGAGAGKV